MINYCEDQNIFSIHAEALVNPVNCVGVSGAGLAAEFARHYPDNQEDYENTCRNKLMKLGLVLLHQRQTTVNPKYIINFPTKNHFRQPSNLDAISRGMLSLALALKHYNIKSVAIPALGCGLGGLRWPDVGPIITQALKEFKDNADIRSFITAKD